MARENLWSGFLLPQKREGKGTEAGDGMWVCICVIEGWEGWPGTTVTLIKWVQGWLVGWTSTFFLFVFLSCSLHHSTNSDVHGTLFLSLGDL
jgi:hypothetical protein